MNPATSRERAQSASPVTVTLPASIVALVEFEANRLLHAQEAVSNAILTDDFGILRSAARSLSIASSQVYGALSVALRDQAGMTAGAPAVRPEAAS